MPARSSTPRTSTIVRRAGRRRAWLRTSAAALACSLALGASGCGDEKLGAGNLKHFNLAKSDLADGFKRDEHVSSRSLRTCLDDPPTAAALAKLVVAGCDTVSYAKADPDDVAALSYAVASVVLLESDGDAATTMREMRKPRRSAIEKSADASGLDVDVATPHSLPVSDLGDEAPRGVMVPASIAGLGTFDFSYYCWRRGKVAACVGTVGPGNGATAALELARTIDGRIADGPG